MPDIDMDFDERRRGDMIRYATERYGEDRVAQIITYGTIKAKAAIKDSVAGARLPVRHGRQDHQGDAAGGDGQGHPARRLLRPDASALQRGGRVPRAVRVAEPDVQKVLDTARGLEGLKRQVGVHAAGRDPVPRAAARRLPIWRRDADGAIITQFDMGAVETLGLLKMDFLGLRNLTVLDDCLASHRVQPRRRPGPGGRCRSTTADVRAARPRRHARRVPARRRADALAAALDEADNFEDISAVLALYRPGPMGANAHNDYADRKNGRKPVVADPPRAGRAAGGDPRRDLRPDRLPGAGHGDRAEGRRLLARRRRPAAPRDGQEEEGDPRQGVRAVLRRHEGARLLRRGDQDALGHPRPVLRLRVQQGAHRRLRPGVVLDRVPEGELPGRVHGGAAHQRPRRQGQVRDLPARVPPDGHQGAAAGRQRVRARFTPVGTDIRFGLGAIRNVGANVVESLRPGAQARRARSPTSPTSCARSSRSPATRGPSSR